MDRIVHEMLIKPEYFEKVKSGEKIYEVRTYSDSRRKMKVGDYIKLLKEPQKTETLLLKIEKMLVFKNFTQLYDALDKKDVGFEGRTTGEIVNELRRFYTPEMEETYGVVAIKVKLLKKPYVQVKGEKSL